MKKYNQTGVNCSRSRKKNLVVTLFIATVVIALAGAFAVDQASAYSLWDMQQGKTEIAKEFGVDANNPRDVRVLIANIIKIFLSFLGIIMIIVVILAGIRWMTAGGNQDRVSQAQQQIKNAAIGMIIILASYAITDFLTDCVFDTMNTTSTIYMCR
ncbi:MAG: pilin [Planctomycetes bacterium]|jgi:flagellar basal body-associated protein FliL|nr:pilin [Planctomycetota bacterium]